MAIKRKYIRKSKKETALPTPINQSAEFLHYQTENGRTRIQVNLKGETFWLSLNKMPKLFDRNKSSVSKNTTNIFECSELMPEQTVAKFATVLQEAAKVVIQELTPILSRHKIIPVTLS